MLVVDVPRSVGISWDPCASLFVGDHRCNGKLERGWRVVWCSGKAMSLRPAWPASMVLWIVTVASKSTHPGSAVTAAALHLSI